MSRAQILLALAELLKIAHLPWWGALVVILSAMVALCVAVFILRRPGMLKHRPGVIDAQTRSRVADYLMRQEDPDLERLIRLCGDSTTTPPEPPAQGSTGTGDVSTDRERRSESPP